jgi:hypothetical protein
VAVSRGREGEREKPGNFYQFPTLPYLPYNTYPTAHVCDNNNRVTQLHAAKKKFPPISRVFPPPSLQLRKRKKIEKKKKRN